MIKQKINRLLRENRGFILFVVLMFVMRSVFADWNHVPSASMKPTLLEGDHIFVNKMAYDIRFPFTHVSLLELDRPKRGDIVIFDSAISDKRLVKRVIGVPGDQVEMRNNRLLVNDIALEYRAVPVSSIQSPSSTADFQEGLAEAPHTVRLSKFSRVTSGFDKVRVPDGHYLVLGDNRDNSADSRVIGFVPRNEIVGRATSVILSFNYDNYFIPRRDRVFHKLL